ncbi:hypothetical protein [Flavobacterium beibuense]|uniref:Uncharacterized protein n=1 Tax=Flavobacterium beibuense TaxID=657326 RepID=A0A444W7G6_9FLAO|nr:hypothetical protein [Flavobacterium beibuense]RYJ41800.1 hypothetical protein NU09_2725 [Flavobacterium beibuense]
MIRLITVIVLFVSSMVSAQSQYETGMQTAFDLWGQGKNSEASAMFERIAAAEKDNWIPNYYVALINTIDAFQTKDKEKVNALLTKAQDAEDLATLVSPDNPELMVMQAMIHTAWIAYDPMTNGMKLSATVKQIYAKAKQTAPDNPRVVFCSAEFDMGGAAYFGQDTTPMCAEIERSLTLFANFKAETPFYPSWGLDRAQQKAAECKK